MKGICSWNWIKEGSPGFYYSQLWNKLGFGHSTYCLCLFLRCVFMREWDARLSLEDAGRRKSNRGFFLNVFILEKLCLNEEQGCEGGNKVSKSNLKSVYKGKGHLLWWRRQELLTDKHLSPQIFWYICSFQLLCLVRSPKMPHIRA